MNVMKCEICEKEFNFNCHLARHLERKLPCRQTENKETRVGAPDIEHNQCEYCHKKLSTPYRLRTHAERCGMMNDAVRILEIKLSKDVSLNPTSTRCRFCKKNFARMDNLRRHDERCKEKEKYRIRLLKVTRGGRCMPGRLNISVTNNVIFNNNMDWNDMHAMRKLLDQLIPLGDIKKYTKTGNVAMSLGDIARVYYSHNDSIEYSNIKSKTMKCRENGVFVSRDADYVNIHNIEPMIHRVQDADDVGHEIPNIDDYGRLDRLTRLDDKMLTREDREFIRMVLDEQKRATHDSLKNRIV